MHRNPFILVGHDRSEMNLYMKYPDGMGFLFGIEASMEIMIFNFCQYDYITKMGRTLLWSSNYIRALLVLEKKMIRHMVVFGNLANIH